MKKNNKIFFKILDIGRGDSFASRKDNFIGKRVSMVDPNIWNKNGSMGFIVCRVMLEEDMDGRPCGDRLAFFSVKLEEDKDGN